jgi:hypothetical protein
LEYDDEITIKTLIELSSDENEDVINRSTFGLSATIKTDNQAIRDALSHRLLTEFLQKYTV